MAKPAILGTAPRVSSGFELTLDIVSEQEICMSIFMWLAYALLHGPFLARPLPDTYLTKL